jgi:tetratricopeptide (TPR) repeat protein
VAHPDDVARAETIDSGRDATGPLIQPGTEPIGDLLQLPSPFVFRRELSRGGMGRVLIAWDRQHGREVAIKVIGGSNHDLIARFQREAQVTARLQHPSIIPVYHSGQLADGDPFYVMRLVSGRSLDAVVEDRSLPARLALLPQVIAAADAVAYAHDRHVVHRDLKPQNILVGDFGETVVIDWGLAKDLVATDAPAGAADSAQPATASLTMVGAVMGTPAYMPPEQARGEEVDERADVYSLGAVLYHVLAGAPPYDGATGAVVIANVLERPPPPLDSELPADLRAIVDKAMARDPERRYPSAAELAADLKKLQTGQLVGAHEYSLFDLVRRFAARQTAAVAVAGVLLVVMVALTAVGLRRITRARDAAELQRAQAQEARDSAEALARYLVVELAERLERYGSIELLRGLGETVVRYEESARRVRAAGQPSARQARALELMAKAEGTHGDLATAEKALRESLQIRRRLAAAAPGNDVAERELLGTEWHLIERILERGGVTAEVKAFVAREPELVQKAAHTTDPLWLDELAQALGEVAAAREMMGGIEAETASLEASVRAAERATSLAPKVASHQLVLGIARSDLADALRRLGQLDRASEELSRALKGHEALVAEHPAEPSYSYELWRSLQSGSLLEATRGDYRRANSYAARTLPLISELERRHPENIDYREGHVYCLDSLGAMAFDQGRYAEAQAHFTDQLRLTDEIRSSGIHLYAVEAKRGHALQLLGWIRVLTGHPDEGIAPMAEALALQERTVAGRPGDTSAEQDLAEQLSDVGYAELRAHRFADAIAHLARAAALIERNLAAEPANPQWQVRGCYAHVWLGSAQHGGGHDEEARRSLERAVSLAAALANHPGVDEDSEQLAAVAETAATAIEILGTGAPQGTQAILRRALPLLEAMAKKGELYSSAAIELKKWRRLAR